MNHEPKAENPKPPNYQRLLMYKRNFYKLTQNMEETDQVWITAPSLSSFTILRKKLFFFIKINMLKLCLFFSEYNDNESSLLKN